MIDRYEGAPEKGWPHWMEAQIEKAEFVLVVCTELYLQKVEGKEEPKMGRGVVWESLLMHTYLYTRHTVNTKFIPVLFAADSEAAIPLALRVYQHYYVDTQEGYASLYARLTGRASVKKPPLGKIRRLKMRALNNDSLPTAALLEQMEDILSNPRYADDLYRLDRVYDRKAVINRETIILVIGVSVVSELLDRAAAELLRAEIDEQGGAYPFRRGIILTDRGWEAEAASCGSNPVIAIGGPPANRLSKEFDEWVKPADSLEGKYTIPGGDALTGFFRKNGRGYPQIGLWGETASATLNAVEHYIKNERGLPELLRMCWK